MMTYRVSHNIRKYSSTPIVRVTIVDGKEQEEMVCISVLKKVEGDRISQKIVDLLNDAEFGSEHIKF